jgi:hypothetical protein
MKRRTDEKHNEIMGNLGDARRILPNHTGMVQDELRKARRAAGYSRPGPRRSGLES